MFENTNVIDYMFKASPAQTQAPTQADVPRIDYFFGQVES